MAIVVKPITVEVSKPNVFQAIAAKQNDSNSRFLKVTFVNEGEKIDIPSSAKVTINAERNDGQSDSFFGAVNDDGTAIVPIHSWILELPGYVDCDVSIIEEDSKLTCTTFSLLVEEASHDSEDISDDEQYDVLTELINQVNTDKSMVANAIVNTASGKAVLLPDVSSIEHDIDVKVRSKNLLNPSIINTWQCNATVDSRGLIAFDTSAASGVAYARVGRVTLTKGKQYVCKAISADNIGSLLFWKPNTSTTVWAVGQYSYTPTEDITLDLAVYMKDITNQTSASCQIQLEEGTTLPTSYTPYLDVSTAKLNASGKNLASINSIEFPITSEVTVFEGDATGDFVLSFDNNLTDIGAMSASLVSYTLNGETFNLTPNSHITNKGIFKISGNLTKVLFRNWCQAQGGSVDNIQIEAGTEKTEFESYNGLETYPINADGTVEGVKRIYPTTTLTTDADAVIDATYNADTKKYIDNKFAELATAIINK